MRIGIYGIALNEVANLDGWLANTEDADHRLIVDTGSTDDTVERASLIALECRDVHVEEISIQPFRFDDAWGAALALLPDDLDVVIHCGMDVRLPDGWRAQLETEWPADAEYAILNSWIESDGLRWRYAFAHSRHGFRWRYPLHEILVADPRVEPVQANSELVFTTSGSRQSAPDKHERNLALFKAARSEQPDDLRLVHYEGRELMYAGQWRRAIEVLTQHATSDAFVQERAESWRYIGDCERCLHMSILDVSSEPYRNACEIDPGRREGWVALANLCREQDRWQNCLDAAEHALAITERSWYFNWPWAWGSWPYDLAALAAHFLGDSERAQRYGQKALDLAPGDVRLANNLAWYGQPSSAPTADDMALLAAW